MRAMKQFILYAALLLGTVSTNIIAAATNPLSKANRLPPSLEQKVQDFRNALEASGYEVARGYWKQWSADDCKLPLQAVGFCYGNNPTSPYVLAIVNETHIVETSEIQEPAVKRLTEANIPVQRGKVHSVGRQ